MRTCGAIVAAAMLGLAAAPAGAALHPVTIGYGTPAALKGLRVVRRVAPLHVAEVLAASQAQLRARPGIRWVEAPVPRTHQGGTSPAKAGLAVASEWEFAATRSNLVPESVVRAAAAVTIAVVDTGADTSVPDIAAKSPLTFNVI